MRYCFLKEHRGNLKPIRKACKLPWASKSDYEYLERRRSNSQIDREVLEGFVTDVFNKYKGCYDYRSTTVNSGAKEYLPVTKGTTRHSEARPCSQKHNQKHRTGERVGPGNIR